jgi:hypothetical protein
MKKLLLLIAGLASVSVLTVNATNALPLKMATVTGTVEIENTLTPTTTQARISTLNNNRVFQEFSVSPTDYALVLDANVAGLLELVPKSASSGLPTLQVFVLGGTKGIIDTKGAFGDVYDTVTSTASGNLFEGFAGAVNGRVNFQKPFGTTLVLKKFVFSGIATGTDQSSAGGTAALIKFKVSAAADFTQKP